MSSISICQQGKWKDVKQLDPDCRPESDGTQTAQPPNSLPLVLPRGGGKQVISDPVEPGRALQLRCS